jgi:hypothetical protein
MPTGERREDVFIDIFLSGYENGLWRDAQVERPEKFQDNAVEAIATRKSDGNTIAIEHTIIEPFIGEKGDFAQFWPSFERLQQDPSLVVPNRITRVFIPVGILDEQKAAARKEIVFVISEWLKANIASLPEGWSKPGLRIPLPGKPAIETFLNIEVLPTPNFHSLTIARQQVAVNLNEVVQKVLRNKIPKLVAASANTKILMLERQHMNLLPEDIIREIEKLRPHIQGLSAVDEIWMAETIFYDRDGVIHFFRYNSEAETTAEIAYWDKKVQIHWDGRDRDS